MLITAVVGYDIAHAPVEAKVPETVQEVAVTPTPTLELTTQRETPTPTPTATKKPQTVEEIIGDRFKEDKTEALKVAFCESSLSPRKSHTNSSAKGLFQIIDGTWKLFKCTGDPLNAEDNTRCAKKIFDYYGGKWNTSGGWAASYGCHKLD